MYAVERTAPGVLEVNYMWLPTWIGMNRPLLDELGEHVRDSVVGKPLDEALRVGHTAVVDFLVAKYPDIKGLGLYLNRLTEVAISDGETS